MNPLRDIWWQENRARARREIEQHSIRTWAEDLRWKYVFGHIKPILDRPDVAYEIVIEVSFDGERYTSRVFVDTTDVDLVPNILDGCVEGIDRLMSENGVAPYIIENHFLEEQYEV